MSLGLADLLVAGLTAILGWFAGKHIERWTARQYRVSADAFASEWFRDLRLWAGEVIDVLSEAIYFAPGRAETELMDRGRCISCRHRISALVDRGRFFLPNFNPDDVGTDKPAAFRGLRHPALDYLVVAEDILAGRGADVVARFGSERTALVNVKRAFVSEIQEILDPRTHNRKIAQIITDTSARPGMQSALERLAGRDHPGLTERS